VWKDVGDKQTCIAVLFNPFMVTHVYTRVRKTGVNRVHMFINLEFISKHAHLYVHLFSN